LTRSSPGVSKEALALFEVRTLDHFVIGDIEAISFAEHGLL
jgi:DNA repair protein RadC